MELFWGHGISFPDGKVIIVNWKILVIKIYSKNQDFMFPFGRCGLFGSFKV